jgi:hypothetical protein
MLQVIRAGTQPRLVFSQPKVAPIRPDREHEVTLPDGRRLGAAEFGPRAALPLV